MQEFTLARLTIILLFMQKTQNELLSIKYFLPKGRKPISKTPIMILVAHGYQQTFPRKGGGLIKCINCERQMALNMNLLLVVVGLMWKANITG